LHNHNGGYLLFGIGNEGTITGIGDDFEKLDNADVNKAINSYFQPSIHTWKKMSVNIDDRKIGVIHVERRKSLPAVCKSNYPKLLSESDIYFRYHSETTKIKYGDLLKMLHELSQSESVTESKRVRKRDIQPFLKGTGFSYSQNQVTLRLQNMSSNVTTIKNVINVSEDGTQFHYRTTNDYGTIVEGGSHIGLQGFAKMSGIYSPWHFRVIFSDKDDNVYYQDFTKAAMSDVPQETLPTDYME
jgi:predicted HTH transcriptional regulator